MKAENPTTSYPDILFFYKAWWFAFFLGMGLIVPQISPFVYDVLKIEKAGTIFLWGQVAMPIGAFLFGYISDKTLHIRYLTLGMTLLCGVTLYLFSYVEPGDIFQAAVLWSLFMFSTGGILPLMNVSYLQNKNQDKRFGRVRLYGTVSFTAVNAGLMFFDFAPQVLVRYSGILAMSSIVFLFFIPPGRDVDSKKEGAITLAQTWRLFSAPMFLLFLGVSFWAFFAFSAAEYIISDYIAPLDFPLDPVPFMWFIGTLTEIAFFFYSPRLLDMKNGALALMAIGIFSGLARYFLMTLPLGPSQIIYVQSLHGLQFTGLYLGSLIYLHQKSHPRRLATAQALFTGFARALGTGLGAYLLGNIAGEGRHGESFLWACLASALSLALLAIFVPLQRKVRYFAAD